MGPILPNLDAKFDIPALSPKLMSLETLSPEYVMSFHNDEHDDTWKNTYKEYIVALYNSVKIIITDPTQIDIWLDDDSVSLKLMGGKKPLY